MTRREAVPGPWIRLEPSPPVSTTGVGCTPAGRTAGMAAFRRVFGCRWLWWTPAPATAWRAVLGATGVRSGRRVVAPEGLDAVATRAVRDAGAVLVEVDLDPRTGYPVWHAAGSLADAAVLLDHRYGRPCPPPDAGATAVLEHATDAVGGAAGGRPVGALGAAMVCVLGRPPFWRSTGALIGTSDPDVAASVAPDLVPLAADDAAADDAAADDAVSDECAATAAGPAAHRRTVADDFAAAGDLWADALGAEDWVAACRAAAAVYTSAWRGARLPVHPLQAAPGTAPSWSAYLAVVPDPAGVVRALARHGVEAAQPALGRASARVVRLPNHPDLGLGELLYVADAVRVYLQGSDSARPGTPEGPPRAEAAGGNPS